MPWPFPFLLPIRVAVVNHVPILYQQLNKGRFYSDSFKSRLTGFFVFLILTLRGHEVGRASLQISHGLFVSVVGTEPCRLVVEVAWESLVQSVGFVLGSGPDFVFLGKVFAGAVFINTSGSF